MILRGKERLTGTKVINLFDIDEQQIILSGLLRYGATGVELKVVIYIRRYF